jgi:putative phosphoesterase
MIIDLTPAVVLGVVSDTHLPRFGRALPAALVRGLTKARVDGIVHCGDLTERLALDLFEEIAPVFAVAGNNDGAALVRRLGERLVLRAGEVRVGVVHGHAGRGRSTPDRAFNAFAQDDVDVILFGHSHMPLQMRRNGIRMFNPGSPTDKRFNPAYSYGILRIDGTSIRIAHRFYLSRAAS